MTSRCFCSALASQYRPFSVYIPRSALTLRFSRSSGPGGQHVNKVNTKVDCRFVLRNATWLTDEQKRVLEVDQARSINNSGELFVTSQRYRSQARNIEDCIEKLQAMMDFCQARSVPPLPPRATAWPGAPYQGGLNLVFSSDADGVEDSAEQDGASSGGRVFAQESLRRARKRKGRGGAKAYLRRRAAQGARVLVSTESQQQGAPQHGQKRGNPNAVGKPIRIKKGKRTMWRWT